MALVPERHRDAAWLAWRALALAAALWLSQLKAGSWTIPLTVYAVGVAAWIVLGWKARRPARLAAAIAVGIVIAEHFAYGLPRGVMWFVPVWAVLFGLPAIFQEGGLVPLLAAWLLGSSQALGRLLRAAAARLGRFPRACECLAIATAAAAGLFAISPFLHNGIMGGVDAKWYAAVVADHVEQWRRGLGPVFVGQTYYAAVGTVMPLRVAPYLQHATVALDFLTGRSLSPFLLLNLAIVASIVAGCLSAYLCIRTILPGRRTEALLLAVLYAWCPAVSGLAYAGQLYMSVMTLPYLPVVFAGVVKIYRRDDLTGWAMVAAGCAACWLAHSPIGLWVSFSAATAIAARWVLRIGLNRREFLRAGGAALLFAGLCGYVFVSILVLDPPAQAPISAALIADTLRGMFPAVLLPVSSIAAFTPDLQPGWGILAVLVLALASALGSRKGAALALVPTAVILVFLSMPIPGVNAWLWRAVPQAVLNATNEVPTQRLFPILAACSVVLAACTLEARRGRRSLVIVGLGLCVAWSGSQLRPFLHRGALIANSAAASEEALGPDNLILTVFSNSLFSVNRFFSYGYMDYALEQRVLGEDMNSYLVTNVGAVAPGYDFGGRGPHRAADGVLLGTTSGTGRRWIDISPKLTLDAGRRYLLAIDFADHPYTGVLQASGQGLAREYILPQSGEHYGFGTDAMNSHVIPLSNPSKAPMELTLDFVVQDPAADLAQFGVFGHYRLIAYDPKDLPLSLESLVPYVARVRSPASGWYESFRYFTRGWTASVNGKPAVVRKSRNGLVAVRVGAGESEVRLAYRPPAALLSAYWLAWATWGGLAFWSVRSLRRR